MGIRDLGTLGGIFSAAQDINDTGQVIGVSEVGTILDRFPSGFITGPNGVGMTNLGGGGEPRFVEINNVGQAAGDFQTQLGFHAFVTGLNGVGRTELVTPGGTDSFAGGIEVIRGRWWGLTSTGTMIPIVLLLPVLTEWA